MLKFHKRRSTQCPDAIDLISSKKFVYIRKNIKRVESMSNGRVEYHYDEAKMRRVDFAIYLAEKNQADTDYVAMMTEVDV